MQQTARDSGLEPYALLTIAQDSVMFTWTYTKDAQVTPEDEPAQVWPASCGFVLDSVAGLGGERMHSYPLVMPQELGMKLLNSSPVPSRFHS